jgi:hypothetical protein
VSLASVQALLRRNAIACEEARFPECKCHCGGAFHGIKHTEAWIENAARELYEAQCDRRFEAQARNRLALERIEAIEAEERRRFGEQLELL